VVTSHYPYCNHALWYTNIRQYGWSGVDLFFVLSGYLIGSQIFREVRREGKLSFGNFYFKRALRILPAYLSVVALYFFFPLVREASGISPLWRFLTFTQNFGLDFGKNGTFSHAWSLCVEEHFYLLLPLLTFVFMKLKRPVRYVAALFLALFIFGPLSRWVAWSDYASSLGAISSSQSEAKYFRLVYYPTYNHLEGLLLGIGLGLFQTFRPNSWKRALTYSRLIFCGGVTFLIVALTVCVRGKSRSFGAAVWGFPLFSISYGCFVLASLSPRSWLSRVRLAPVSWLSTLAFCTYLTHKPVIKYVHQWTGQLGYSEFGVQTTAATIFAILGVASVLHFLVEEPFLRYRDRKLAQRRSIKASSLSYPLPITQMPSAQG